MSLLGSKNDFRPRIGLSKTAWKRQLWSFRSRPPGGVQSSNLQDFLSLASTSSHRKISPIGQTFVSMSVFSEFWSNGTWMHLYESMGGMHRVSLTRNFRCVGNLFCATVNFFRNTFFSCKRLRSFTPAKLFFPQLRSRMWKIDFSETFARRFPNFEDSKLWSEEELLSSTRRFEWCIERPDRITLRRDTIFEYAASSAIPTSRVSMWHST